MKEVEPTPNHAEAQAFVDTSAQSALEALGYGGVPNVRFGDGWACDMNSGDVIVDAASFGDESYKPKWRVLALQHEVEAHASKVHFEPESAEWDRTWSKEHPAGGIFLNILADVAGNRQIMTKDPSAREGWHDFYASKLFGTTDFQFQIDEAGQPTDKPLPKHIQMLYATIREKMVPDEPCTVDPEVRQVLEELAHFQGEAFDLLDYATQTFKTPTEYLSRMEQMRLWRSVIWPKYLELYEKDAQDPNFTNPNNSGQPQSGSGGSGEAFQPMYDEYEKVHHPGKPQPTNGETGKQQAIDIIMQGLPEAVPQPGTSQKTETQKQPPAQPTPGQEGKLTEKAATSKERAEAVRGEIARKEGVTPQELTTYLGMQRRVQNIIGEMHTVFEQFINERAAMKWRLSHQHQEGVLLDPDNLARTVIQMRSGHEDDMRPYMDYEQKELSRELNGKLDLWLIVDTSVSMSGTKSKVAAESAVAVLEGLDDFNQQIAETSQSLGYELDFDARTAVLTFSDGVATAKPLGKSLTVKERISAVGGIQNVRGGTADFLGIDAVAEHYAREPADDRKKVIIVLSDGESNDTSKLSVALGKVKKVPGMNVFAVGIESPDAEKNYAPNGKTIQNVSELPATLSTMVTNLFK
jgi:uncharacterized protein YegL